MVWSGAQVVDRPRRGPHGVQRAVMARNVAQAEAEAIDDWITCGKVFMGRIHGPWRTRVTQSKASDHSDEGGRRRCGAHRRGRRRQSSTAVNVSVLWVEEQL
jgi:hypothetical protein